MIAPAVIGLGVFLIWPTFYGIALSFTDFNLLTAPEGVGVNNYLRMVEDPVFWNAAWVTVYSSH